MPAEELGVSLTDEHLRDIKSGVADLNKDMRNISELLTRHDEKIPELRKDVDVLVEIVGTDGRNGLIEEMRHFSNSLDHQLRTKTEGKRIDPQWVAQWVAIGAGVIAYIVEILLPLWRL